LRKISSIEEKNHQKIRRKTVPSSKSAKQLLHLANKIKDVEVDHEIDNYLPAIITYLKTYRRVNQEMVSVEFNRLSNIKKLETFQINQVLKDVTETVLKRK
jgi:ATP-dependent RNA helicase DeaD